MIALTVEGLESVKWENLWPRHIAYGECEAWCGAGLVVCVTRPFTPDEDLVFDWVMKQDACELYGIAHLSDGRDLIVLDRMYKTQTMHEAQVEHYDHIRAVLEAHGVTPLVFTG